MFGREFCIMFNMLILFFFFKQKTAYDLRISDWSSDVCSSDLLLRRLRRLPGEQPRPIEAPHLRVLAERLRKLGQRRGALPETPDRARLPLLARRRAPPGYRYRRAAQTQLPLREATRRPSARLTAGRRGTGAPDAGPQPAHGGRA